MPGRTRWAREGRTGLCWALPWSVSLRSVSRQPREETEVGLFPTDVPDRGPLGGQALWQGSPHLSPPCFPLASLGAPHLLSQASRPQLCRGHTCLQGTPASSRGGRTPWIRSGGFMNPRAPHYAKCGVPVFHHSASSSKGPQTLESTGISSRRPCGRRPASAVEGDVLLAWWPSASAGGRGVVGEPGGATSLAVRAWAEHAPRETSIPSSHEQFESQLRRMAR